MSEETLSVELEKLEKAIRISKLYLQDHLQLERNPNLAYIVHATLHFSQFFVITSIEVFHYANHAVHKQLMLVDPTLLKLNSERDLLLILNIPFNMILSIILCSMWLCAKGLKKKNEFSMIACIIQSMLSLINAIVVMRQAHNRIIHAEVPQEDVISHPIFIHCFVISMLSIFGFSINQIQFWLLFDCVDWGKSEGTVEIVSKTPSDESHPSREDQTSDRIASEELEDHSVSDRISANIEDDSINFYCCCVDYYNYLRLRSSRDNKVNHEFQVVYIM